MINKIRFLLIIEFVFLISGCTQIRLCREGESEINKGIRFWQGERHLVEQGEKHWEYYNFNAVMKFKQLTGRWYVNRYAGRVADFLLWAEEYDALRQYLDNVGKKIKRKDIITFYSEACGF